MNHVDPVYGKEGEREGIVWILVVLRLVSKVPKSIEFLGKGERVRIFPTQ